MKSVIEYVPKTEKESKMKTNIIATIVSFLALLGTIVSYFSKQENRFTVLEQQNKNIISGIETINKSSEKLLSKLDKNSSDIATNKVDIAINKVKVDSVQKDVMKLERPKKKMSTKPTSLSPELKQFLEKNFAKIIEIFQLVMAKASEDNVREWVFLGLLNQDLGVVDNDSYSQLYYFLYDKIKDKTKKLQRDEKKAFDRQVKLLDEIRVLAKEQNNLKVCLESIKEQNKLVGLYNFNYFDSSQNSKNLDNIQNKIYKELELELFDEDLDED